MSDQSAAAAVRGLTQALTIQFGFSHWLVQENAKGLTDAECLLQMPGGGSTVNWIAGHLLSTRNALLGMLGADPVWADPRAADYGRGTQPVTDAGQGVPCAEILGEFVASQEPLLAALAELTPEQLAQPAPFSPAGRKDETVGTLLPALAFHEAYHAGQIGLLRRLAGKQGSVI